MCRAKLQYMSIFFISVSKISSSTFSRIIAFHAYVNDGNYHSRLSAGSLLNFDGVRTNLGGGYNRGSFTAPVSGCYVFTWNIRCSSCNIPTNLLVNGNVVGAIDATTYAVNGHATPTGIVVVQVSAGDTVMVRIASGYTPTNNLNSNHWHYSTFSGWLLH